MSNKPTGVFVRLPVTDEQAQEMYRAYCAAYASSSLTTRGTATQAALLTIGTPVTGSASDPDAYEYEIEQMGFWVSREKGYGPPFWARTYYEEHPNVLHSPGSVRNIRELVYRDGAQAQIAALEAEVVCLREALDRIRLIPFPMMDLPAGIMHGIAHKALKGGAA